MKRLSLFQSFRGSVIFSYKVIFPLVVLSGLGCMAGIGHGRLHRAMSELRTEII
jgi:hypothetical protein